MPTADTLAAPLTKRQRREWYWLTMAAGRSVMYPGTPCEDCPDRLMGDMERRGLVRLYQPHNAAHKNRWAITDAGRALLATLDAAQEDADA